MKMKMLVSGKKNFSGVPLLLKAKLNPKVNLTRTDVSIWTL